MARVRAPLTMLGDNLLRRSPAVTSSWTCPWFVVILASSTYTAVTGLIDGSVLALAAAFVAGMVVAYCVGIRLARRVPLRGGSCR